MSKGRVGEKKNESRRNASDNAGSRRRRAELLVLMVEMVGTNVKSGTQLLSPSAQRLTPTRVGFYMSH